MANGKYALSINGTVFQVTAADGGKIMDMLADAPQIDNAWTAGTEFAGQSHREATYPAEIRLQKIQGDIISREAWKAFDERREAIRAAEKAANEKAAADQG